MTDPASTDAAPARLRRTPLTAVHEELGATLTDFAGWLMPLRYGSEIAEHTAVRGAAGLFDLSHMGEITVSGPGAADALDYALVGRLERAEARPRPVHDDLDADGGVLDDLVVYRLARRGVPGRGQRRQRRGGGRAAGRPGRRAGRRGDRPGR